MTDMNDVNDEDTTSKPEIEQLEATANAIKWVLEKADCANIAGWDPTSAATKDAENMMAKLGEEVTRLTKEAEELEARAAGFRDSSYKIVVQIIDENTGETVLDVDQPKVAPREMGDAMARMGNSLLRQGPVMQIVDQARTVTQARDTRLRVDGKIKRLCTDTADRMSMARQRYTAEVIRGESASAVDQSKNQPENEWLDKFRPGRM